MSIRAIYPWSVYLLLVCVLALYTSRTASIPVLAQQTIGPGDEYNPEINPEDFTTNITNPYFSLPVGKKWVYEAETPDGLERIEILIPGWTRNVAGVETLVFWDRVYLDDELIEDTRDYLAQHKETGDVWYFGEYVDNYENGEIVDHDGAWLTGEDNAKPGIWVLANPQVGDRFRNEYRKGEAEDESEVLSISETVMGPYGTFTDCIKHLDGSPLFEAKAHTYYCKDVANTVLEVDLLGPETPVEQIVELVEADDGGARDMTMAPEEYAAEGVVGPSAEPTSDVVTCVAASGVTIAMPTTYFYIEHNATAGDTGVHGMFDSSTFAELCVYDPNGTQILAIKPQNQLADLTMAGIFFESREPEHSETSVEEHLQNFPEGQYTVRGVTYDGIGYHGTATFTHNVPQQPQMIFPPEMVDEENIGDVVVAPHDVEIVWEPVTETIFGDPVEIAGYEVIVRRLTPANPHGFAHANYDVHVLPTATSLSIPDEFWEPNTPYEWEVLALEASGNQTLTSGFFMTSDGDSSADIGEALPFADARPIIEFNTTDGDVGFHVELGGDPWKKVSIFDPSGNKLFDVQNQGSIGTQGLSSLNFESAEPPLDEVPLDEFLTRFPAGEYTFIGETVEGETLTGIGEFTHNLPDAPVVISPADGEVVDRENVVIAWEPVSSPDGIEIEVYQLQLYPVDPPEGEEPIDLNIDLTFEVPYFVTEVIIASDFLAPNAEYAYELMAVEASGNRTFTISSFKTE